MNRILPLLTLAGALALAPALSAQTGQEAPPTTHDNQRMTVNDDVEMVEKSETIAELAMRTPELSMLVEALQKTGLAETMMGEGPYTVFAPTNDALDRADAEDLDADELKAVLLLHVVEGEYNSGDMNQGMMLKTMNGGEIGVNFDEADPLQLLIQQVPIVAADIEASNGVIHVINEVILPNDGAPLGN
jgi:uncharacterized surface protein with fasciclin (FAS1) repeats